MNKETGIGHLVQRCQSGDEDRNTTVAEERRKEEVLQVDE